MGGPVPPPSPLQRPNSHFKCNKIASLRDTTSANTGECPLSPLPHFPIQRPQKGVCDRYTKFGLNGVFCPKFGSRGHNILHRCWLQLKGIIFLFGVVSMIIFIVV